MSQKVKVVTDSTADIPEETRRALGIEMVPLKVHFGETTFLDGVTLSPEQFYKRLEEADELPTTSQPSPNDFVSLYQKIIDEGTTEIISIHLSAALSGTYQSAVIAKSMLEEKASIEVINSKLASYAIGMVVVAVAEAANSGKSLAECRQIAEQYINELRVYFVVDTLKYLEKGGRIGKAAALVGSLLNIKPILKLDEDGEVAAVEKVRGRRRALTRILDKLEEYSGNDPVHISVLHANVPDEIDHIKETLTNRLHISKIEVGEIGPVIGTHAGPGTIGFIAIKTANENLE